MNKQDYQDAARKLREFVHESKMQYDVAYRIAHKMRLEFEDMIWSVNIPDRYTSFPRERVYFNGLLSKMPMKPESDWSSFTTGQLFID